MQRGKLSLKRQNLNALFESLRLARINKKLKYYHEIDLWLFGNTNIFFLKNGEKINREYQNQSKTNDQMFRQADEGNLCLFSATLLPGRELHGDGRRCPMRTVPARFHRKRTDLQARNLLCRSSLLPRYFLNNSFNSFLKRLSIIMLLDHNVVLNR